MNLATILNTRQLRRPPLQAQLTPLYAGLGLAAVALYPPQVYLIPKLQRKINALSKERVQTARALSDRIGDYWVNFARTGDANGAALPQWPRARPAWSGRARPAPRSFLARLPGPRAPLPGLPGLGGPVPRRRARRGVRHRGGSPPRRPASMRATGLPTRPWRASRRRSWRRRTP